MSVFEQAVAFLLRPSIEGGYVESPIDDPGGETNFGISKRAYPNEDIKNMTRERAAEIYLKDYWQYCRCDELPPSVALLVFDAAVNQGQPTAIRMLQAEVGVSQDGLIGPKTLKAVSQRAADDLAFNYAARRGARYAEAPNRSNILGWMRRLLDCYRLSMVIA